MDKTRGVIAAGLMLCVVMAGLAAAATAPASSVKLDNIEVTARPQFSAVKPASQSFIEVRVKLAKGWHTYADEATAPGGMRLKLTPTAAGMSFSEAVFPPWQDYVDPGIGQHIRVYTGEFAVYLPFTAQERKAGAEQVEIKFECAVCTDQLCTIKNGSVAALVTISPDAPMDKPAFTVTIPSPAVAGAGGTSLFVALPLAILAGLILNIMPCVWPVLPIVIMRLLNQAGQSRGRSLLFGVAFSAGILLFFMAFAVVNIVLRVGFGAAFSFADLSQSADYLIFMSLLLVVLAMFMFGVFSVGIPSSLTGKAGGGSGVAGSVGTGFLAAILATPCSFGILVAVLVWAQSQPIPLATLTIMLIGVGMSLPYLALTAIPGLMSGMPRPGRWMDIFKQAIGFVLLLIAVKQVAGLPPQRLIPLLYFVPVLAFAVWMWGSWVDYAAPARRKWTVRLIAVVLTVAAGAYLLPAPSAEKQLIKWQPYDAAKIDEALKSGRPVLMDFTAAWCFNCTVLDKVVYTRRDIADLVTQKNVLPVRADVTLAEYPAAAALKKLNESAIPLNVLFVPGQEQPLKLRGILIGAELKKAMEALPQPPKGDAVQK
jgi:thiol:disulfide interchange protein